MNVALLFGGMEHSIYPDLYDECLNRVDGFLIIDTPLNRHRKPQVFNRYFPSDVVKDFFYAEPHLIAAMIEKIAQWQRDYTISLSINVTEEFLVSAAFCNDYFRFSNPGVMAAKISSDKRIQRALMPDLSPTEYYRNTPVDHIEFPVVVKPTDSHGGQGFTILTNVEDWQHYMTTASENIVIEQYIQGVDCSVEAMAVDGEIVFQGVTEEISLPAPLDFLEMGYYQPPLNFTEECIEALKAYTRTLVQRVQFKTGILHAEFRIQPNGKIFFIEFAARPPGDSVLAMYRHATDASLEAQFLNVLQHKAVNMAVTKRYAGQHFYVELPSSLPDWMQSAYQNRNCYENNESRVPARFLNTGNSTGIQEFVQLTARTIQGKPESSADRQGFVIYTAPTQNDMQQLSRTIESILHTKEGEDSCLD
ncbi:MAG: ATP-grasp domain-containing protein [Reinekea sp.]